MKIGEVSLLTNDVMKMADFYKKLLETDNGSNDEVHQTLIGQETMLTIYNDGSEKNNRNQNICLAFTVDDIEKAYHRVISLGAEIIEPPTARPWGAVNMSFYDPDGNTIYLRAFPGPAPNGEESNPAKRAMPRVRQTIRRDGCLISALWSSSRTIRGNGSTAGINTARASSIRAAMWNRARHPYRRPRGNCMRNPASRTVDWCRCGIMSRDGAMEWEKTTEEFSMRKSIPWASCRRAK